MICAIVAATLTMAVSPVGSNVDELKWMAGSWECAQFGGTFEEHWMPATGGSMQGVGKAIVDGKTVFMEFLSIEEARGVVTMWIAVGALSKGDKKPVPFKLSESGPGMATFSNLKHDFPNKIVYTRKTGGDLFCRISGKQGGKEAHEDFAFKKKGRAFDGMRSGLNVER